MPLLHRFNNTKFHYSYVVILVAIWLAIVYAQPLLRALNSYQVAASTQGLLLLFIMAFYGVVLSLARTLNLFKPVVLLLIVIAAPTFYYMQKYGIVIDSDMIINTLETDPAEASDQLSKGLIVTVLGLGVIPALLVVFSKLRSVSLMQRIKQGVFGVLLFSLLGGSTAFVHYDSFASLFRNHRDLKYRVVPFNVVSASISVLKQKFREPEPFVALGLDARKDASSKPKVMIVIVGETARADHFSVNGYPRKTTPFLDDLAQQQQLISYQQSMSCGTATAISVPCMFSFFNADNYQESARNTSNVLDVLNQVGIETLWVENNSGCKNVCDRIRTISIDKQLCQQQDCYDTMMLEALRQELSAPKADKIIVLHQMGSHGPAYFKRSPPSQKVFLPECETVELNDCATTEIINAYDNSLRVTDQLIHETIQLASTLADTDVAVMYVSDHGESLGESGIYLHGLPNWMAPVAQRHIPWVVWPSKAFKTERELPGATLSHDYLSHTLLGYFAVDTSLYQAELDLSVRQQEDIYAHTLSRK
jgi:Predicted membrane-associated, metal-dependent hydrolase